MRQDRFYRAIRIGSIVTMMVASLLLAGGARAQVATGVIRVAPSGTDVAGCGSAAQPCRTPYFAVIQSLRNSSFQGDVRLAGGTYSQSSDPQLIKVTVFPANLRIIGGYSTSNWNVSNPSANPTILDGQGSKRGILISVPDNIAPFCNVTVSGLTVVNGRAGSDDPYGGGILIDNCQNARVENVTVRDSKAIGVDNTNAGGTSPGAGGGIAVRGNTNVAASLTLRNVTIENGEARGGNESAGARGGLGNGGGLFAIFSRVTATDLTVTNSSARAGDAPGGSGQGGDGQLADSLGGGISLINVPLFSFDGLTVTGNSARGGNATGTGGYGLGGGIFLELSAGTIRDAVISDNDAVGGNATSNGGGSEGGAIHSTGTALTLVNVIMANNSVTGGTGGNAGEVYGGGLFTTASGDAPALNGTNLIIAANRVTGSGFSGGGGMALRKTVFNLEHVTLADNEITSAGEGGQAAIFFVTGTSGTLRNSITSGHSGSNSFYVPQGVSGVTLNRLLNNDTTTELLAIDVGASATQQNVFTGNPRFVAPGGPDYDYRIGGASAAIDQAAGSAVTEDIEGQVRPVGAAADVGADELQIAVSATTGSGTIALDWDAPPGTTVTRYEVQYTKQAGAGDAQQGPSPINAGTDTDLTLTGLTNGASYTVTIVAFNGAAEVAHSAPITRSASQSTVALPLVVN